MHVLFHRVRLRSLCVWGGGWGVGVEMRLARVVVAALQRHPPPQALPLALHTPPYSCILHDVCL